MFFMGKVVYHLFQNSIDQTSAKSPLLERSLSNLLVYLKSKQRNSLLRRKPSCSSPRDYVTSTKSACLGGYNSAEMFLTKPGQNGHVHVCYSTGILAVRMLRPNRAHRILVGTRALGTRMRTSRSRPRSLILRRTEVACFHFFLQPLRIKLHLSPERFSSLLSMVRASY